MQRRQRLRRQLRQTHGGPLRKGRRPFLTLAVVHGRILYCRGVRKYINATTPDAETDISVNMTSSAGNACQDSAHLQATAVHPPSVNRLQVPVLIAYNSSPQVIALTCTPCHSASPPRGTYSVHTGKRRPFDATRDHRPS